MATQPSFFHQAKQPHLRPSPKVILLVDFINPMQFLGAEKLVPAALQAAQATARLKKRLDAKGVTSIYANDNYGIWRSKFKDLLSACKALPGARGEIATLLEPGDNDLTILKPLHSAFHATPLDHLLKQLKVRELIVTGLAADMCVHLTAMDAYMRGYKVWVPRDCTAAENEEYKEAALRQMSQVLKCSVRKSQA
ncbi:MAG: cysteine hydrolase [Alcaligenaceae bacterium]|nr:MAG: cysteine hydrolase [Alcaligenaceae bacterium]